MNPHPYPLTTQELRKLAETLYELEIDVKRANGIVNINGSFAIAQLFDYDEHIIDIEVKTGTQDEGGSYFHTEQYKINRSTMEVMN